MRKNVSPPLGERSIISMAGAGPGPLWGSVSWDSASRPYPLRSRERPPHPTALSAQSLNAKQNTEP